MIISQFAVILIKSKYVSGITFYPDEDSLFKYIRSLYHLKFYNKGGRKQSKRVIVLEWDRTECIFNEVDDEMYGRILHQYELEERNAKLREKRRKKK